MVPASLRGAGGRRGGEPSRLRRLTADEEGALGRELGGDGTSVTVEVVDLDDDGKGKDPPGIGK